MLAAIPWPIFVLMAGAIGLPVVYLWVQAVREERLLRRAGLNHARQMPLPDFIRYLETLFTGLGYHVRRTPQRDDYGADLLLKDGTGRQTAINARHFKERIAPEVLREVASGAEHHECEETLVVSIIGFANMTIDDAEETGTILWDASDLADAMEKVRTRPQPRLSWDESPAPGDPRGGTPEGPNPFARAPLAPGPAAQSPFSPAPVAAARQPVPLPPAPEPQAPSGPPCPICKQPMEAKIAAGREIWLCSRFPRCNGAALRETSQ